MLEIVLVFGGILLISLTYACIKANRVTEDEIIAELVKDSCFTNKLLKEASE